MSRVRRQSLIVEEKKPKDACSWGLWRSGGDTRRDPLNQRQLSRHQSKCRLGGLGGLSSRLNGLRRVCVSGMLLPGVAPSRSLPMLTLRAKVGSSPDFSAHLCYHERRHNWPAGCRHQNSRSRKNGAMLVVVVSHSLIRVDH